MSATADPAARGAQAEPPAPARRRALRRVLMAIGVYTVPYLYVAYMWLVYRTSRVGPSARIPGSRGVSTACGVFALWHQEVFFVAYGFGGNPSRRARESGRLGLDHRAHARDMRSTTCSAAALPRANSGGSTAGVREDGRPHAAAGRRDLRDHDRRLEGPAYRMKRWRGAHRGGDRHAGRSWFKTWCKRYFQLPTWDRTLVPLPFNRIFVRLCRSDLAEQRDCPGSGALR